MNGSRAEKSARELENFQDNLERSYPYQVRDMLSTNEILSASLLRKRSIGGTFGA